MKPAVFVASSSSSRGAAPFIETLSYLTTLIKAFHLCGGHNAKGPKGASCGAMVLNPRPVCGCEGSIQQPHSQHGILRSL
jgi:hypothetical protein